MTNAGRMTGTQRELARHALGLPNKRNMTYRNHFCIGKGGDGYDDCLMTRVARTELLTILRRERDGILLDVAGLREPMKRRFRRRPMDPLAWAALQNEFERMRESRKRKRK